MIEEIIYISAFNVNANGSIEVRKTTDVVKDGVVIASSFWRGVLAVNDPTADEVLGVDTYYGNIAAYTWSITPAPEVVVEETTTTEETPVVDSSETTENTEVPTN
jgi:hypothetical protein